MGDTAIACDWENFRHPLLRRFKLQGKAKFIDLVGYRLDGIVWKVEIGGCIVALKVRECQNASLLQKMHFVIEYSSDSVWLNPKPKIFNDTLRNLYAFSDEGRRR
ncbi:hypothetical protein TOPH_08820 [Tolypocladium ophioglossoides CBS 100239]|uniref:Uncharacterized protein n=1 Tax=Tolypocladium ophioglossoides (strain CBS 100239) TaxID=1163406 RepID=A0A0L0MYI8_TOLOC|nr:hypothetical protein TOPH_08820 [Tolypocladium ophioglossoides CBS 100239]